ncbi:MAG: hypothetical protein JJP05_00185 [cyanobacterium endosymbiont of Rhopalodia gibba]|jgi:L-lactate permease
MATTIDGSVIVCYIFYILFGTVFLLNNIIGSRTLSTIYQGLLQLSVDRRIQVIITA